MIPLEITTQCSITLVTTGAGARLGQSTPDLAGPAGLASTNNNYVT